MSVFAKPTPVPRGSDQPLKAYNDYKRFLNELEHLTDDQLAQLHYEAWHYAYLRSNKLNEDNTPEVSQ